MSNSLLNNKYLNKLDVNRLQVNQLKANEVLPKTKSYLYSAILNNVEFKKIENGDYNVELIINLTNQKEVIQFTDRPFTQSSKITIQQFVQLFLLREPDSFRVQPPNVVLIFNNTQKSYTMSLANFFAKENNVVFNLKLLTGEEHTQKNFIGTINMFVDESLAAAAADADMAADAGVAAAANVFFNESALKIDGNLSLEEPGMSAKQDLFSRLAEID